MVPEEESALPVADPPNEFDVYELVRLMRPADPRAVPAMKESELELLQRQHLGHLAAMAKAGHLKAAGPMSDQPDERWRGICLYQVGSLEEARRLAEQDPSVRAGRLEIEVMHWYTRKGALRFA
jgi:uncharacterized protein YciI